MTMPKKPKSRSGELIADIDVYVDHSEELFCITTFIQNKFIPSPIDIDCLILVRDKNYQEYYDKEPIKEYDEFWDREEEYQGQWLIKEEWFW